MNTIKYLTDQDFSIQDGKKGQILCANLKGISIVLFYSKKCIHCQTCMPVFMNLSRLIPACQFAMLNVSTYYNVATSSAKTIAPIDVVPYIVLYVNGRPFMRYNGDKTEDGIGEFITNVLTHIQSRKNFSTMKIDVSEHEIPAYSIAVPYNVVCEGDECYLSFKDAYTKNNAPSMAVSRGQSGLGGMANQERERYNGQNQYNPQTRRELLNGLNYGQANPRGQTYNDYSGM